MDKTPSGPTLSIASAIICPINSSFPAEIDATALISSPPLTGLAFFSNSSTNPCTVLSIPLLRDTGFAPEVTLRSPSLIISRARTEAVVVPSPAESLVLLATSLIRAAPAFSMASGSSIARAMVTPSLTTFGLPNSSNTTFLPLGPRVSPTASASLSMPA
ncbi:hypothetical protein V8G54_023336 [Vigna mungo]|uniref:Uncharacterized protein n=1 Tax=Vigna mungo TaxID=3915 RepID=A0AAQ3N511_VIGMU